MKLAIVGIVGTVLTTIIWGHPMESGLWIMAFYLLGDIRERLPPRQ